MRSKAAFIVGAGVGYVLGTRAGRQQFEKIADVRRRAWSDPRVQSAVTGLEAKAGELAKSEGSALLGKVTSTVQSRVGSVRGGGESSTSGSTPPAVAGGTTEGGGTGTEPGSPFVTPPGPSYPAGQAD